jgi:hypothetical protein
LQDAQNGRPARPQRVKTGSVRFSTTHPELSEQLFPRVGYVEDAFKARTPLDGVFSSHQNKK